MNRTELILIQHPELISCQQSMIIMKLERSRYRFCVISDRDVNYFPIIGVDRNNDDVVGIQNAWRNICHDRLNKGSVSLDEWSYINKVGDRPRHFLNPFIRHFRNDPTGLCYFILISETTDFPWYELYLLANYSKIEDGFLPLHSSGIIYKGKLLLFCGPSGAGKSTVASMSHVVGAKSLDEDQLLIRDNCDGTFSADAWGYSLDECQSKIAGVFNLVQGHADTLSPLSGVYTTRMLFARAMDTCGNTDSRSIWQKMYSFSAKLCRSIPGYELHFRKSPDFWNLIDAEFPRGG